MMQKAKDLLEQHGKLSVPFLMRKFKIDFYAAQRIMEELGLKLDLTPQPKRRPKFKTISCETA